MIDELDDEFKPKKTGDIDDFNPIDFPKIERSYTGGESGSGAGVNSNEYIPEPELNTTDFDESEDVTEKVTGSGSSEGNKRDFSGFNYQKKSPDVEFKDSETKGETKELNPEEQKKAVRKTAQILTDTYCQVVPMGFAHWAKFNVNKLNKLAREGEINPNMQVGDTTLSNFVKHTNSQIEQAFEVPEEEKKQIKEAVQDVLAEKNVAMSPTTRLAFVMLQSMGRMYMTAQSIRTQNNEFLEQMIYLSKMQATGNFANPAPFSDAPEANVPDPSENYQGGSGASRGGSGSVSDVENYTETKEHKPVQQDNVVDAEEMSVEQYLNFDKLNNDPSVEQLN